MALSRLRFGCHSAINLGVTMALKRKKISNPYNNQSKFFCWLMALSDLNGIMAHLGDAPAMALPAIFSAIVPLKFDSV